jgi:site-specific DNA recombinase
MAATKSCVLYARLSVSSEESVSIERQIEAGKDYAKARGWKVVGTYTDDGVSATHNQPEARKGWGALLAHPTHYDAVVIWKVDRLARRTLDFLLADKALRKRKAGVVAVQDPVDMTTAQGRAFATMLAVFAELEAEGISARVKDARAKLLRDGRYVGGSVPYGWRKAKNPKGAGWVVEQDPERIGYVREMVARTQAGRTLYSTMQWLNEGGATIAPWHPPLVWLSEGGAPTASWHPPLVPQVWAYNTVEGLLRQPILAGLTSHNPGHRSRERGPDVLRDPDTGLPRVNEALAVMPVDEWRAMVAKMDAPSDGRSMPRAMRRKTSGLLSGLVWCQDCEVRMWRGTTAGNPSYSCPSCHQTISKVEPIVVDAFLRERGDVTRWSVVKEVRDGGSALLPEINQRLSELGLEYLNARGERSAEIVAQMTALKEMQQEAEGQPAEVRWVPTRGVQDFAEDWHATDEKDDEARRDILGDALRRVWVARGRPGEWTPASKLARLTFDWKVLPNPEQASDAELAAWAAESA